MIQKCPGQDSRNLRIEITRCPHCKYKLEIFSDEIKAKCPGCGKAVLRKKLPSCLDWCAYAKECMRGVEKYDGNKSANEKNSGR